MTFPLKRELQVLAVSAGSLLLVGPLSYIAVTGGARTIDRWLGTGVLTSGPASTVLTLVAVVISLLVASIAVDIQFRGFGTMNGRGLRTAIDYVACWIVVLGGTVVALDIAGSLFAYEYGTAVGNGPIVMVLSVLVLLAVAGATIRVANAFRAGLRDPAAPKQ